MGLFDQSMHTQEISASLLLPGFQANGTFRVLGILQTYLNDDQRGVFSLYDVTLFGLEQGNPATSISIPEWHVRKDTCHVVAFPRMVDGEHISLMPRGEQLAVYTTHYAIQGTFYMGGDSFISDFIEASKSFFIVATNVSIFPLFAAQTAMVQQAPLACVHKQAVRMHHVL